MKVVLFGATGMVGQGVLRECLLDPDVESVLAIVRNSSLPQHGKLREMVHQDVSDLSAIEERLSGYDACFFCLGVSSVGMKEEAYRRLTYDVTVSAAKTQAKLNPTMTFIYVSGAGTDSTERGRQMWARVKGRTENTLLEMPFKAVYLFRPAYIQPLHGIRTKTRWYGAAYTMMKPFYPLLKMLLPNYVTKTECVGRAMLNVTKQDFPNPDSFRLKFRYDACDFHGGHCSIHNPFSGCRPVQARGVSFQLYFLSARLNSGDSTRSKR